MLNLIVQLICIVFCLLIALRWFLKNKYGKIDRNNEISAKGKIVIITGANTGIGKATALEFAHRDAHVILACRDMKKANEAIQSMRIETSRGELVAMQLDLASLDSVRRFASEFKKKYEKLDILINNAAVMLPPYKKLKTTDNFEIHMGVNHLGHFLLTNLLLDNLKKAAPSRIVNVSAIAHVSGVLDFNDLMGEKKLYNGFLSRTFIGQAGHGNLPYSNSKLANALFSKELAKRLDGTGVTTYALCPGIVNTTIIDRIDISKVVAFMLGPVIRFLLKTPQEGAWTTMYCALNKSLANHSGDMYQHCRFWDPKDRIPLSNEDATKLWNTSEKLVKLDN